MSQERLAAATNELARAFGHAWGAELLMGVTSEVLRAADEAEGRAEEAPRFTLTREEIETLEWAVAYTKDELADGAQRRVIDGILERLESAVVG